MKTKTLALRRVQSDPLRLVKHLGIELWSGQMAILDALCNHPVVMVQSCHEIGKTFVAGLWAALRFCTITPHLLVTTAPTWRQVNGLLWGEMRALYAAHPGLADNGPLETPNWKVSPKHRGIGFSSDKPANVSGWHERNGTKILDEAAGIQSAVWPGLDSLSAGGNWSDLSIGNPDTRLCEFYRRINAGLGCIIKIGYRDTPHFTGEKVSRRLLDVLITPEYVERTAKRYGESSAIYRAKCEGEFPDSDSDSLIPSTWIEAALDRHPKPTGIRYAGLDIARYGSDDSILNTLDGNVLTTVGVWHGIGGPELVGRVRGMVGNVSVLVADADGLGGPIADYLRQTIPAIDFHGGMSAPDAGRGDQPCANLRTRAYWLLREAIRDWLKLPNDPLLIEELESIQYGYSRQPGKREAIQIEPKDAIKKRIGRSPDRADAAAYAVWAASGETDYYVGRAYSPAEWSAY